jgi:inosine-uridine nucleoside N-ribohydrolase
MNIIFKTPFKVIGISTVVGCVHVEQAVANIARTLRANGKTNVTVAPTQF